MGDLPSLAGLKQRPSYMAGQKKNAVDITGGTIANVTITDATLVNVDGITFDSPLPIVSGGTGAGTASAARTALGVAIGTDVQAYNANLTAWAGKTAPAGTVIGTTDAQALTNKSYNGLTLTSTTGTLTLANGSTLATSGANSITLTSSGATNVTLPTSGTLVNSAITTLSSLASIGTVTTGTWNASVIAGQYGGTGVANTGKTITLGNNLTTSGNFALTLTQTGTTNVTLPTTGTLATLAGAETLSNKTFPSITFSTTTGIVGTTTNNDAAALSVGEYLESEILLASQISLTTATTANVTSLALTAGDWDVWGTVVINPSPGTTVTIDYGAISTTSATLPTSPGKGAIASWAGSVVGTVPIHLAVGTRRVSLSGTTTVYLVAQSTFSGSTNFAFGIICARRVR